MPIGLQSRGRGAIGRFAQLAGSNLSAQLLGALSVPLLARLYGPQALGVYAFVLAASNAIKPVLTARLELALLRAPTEETAARVTALTLAVLCVGGVLICGVALLARLFAGSATSASLAATVLWVGLIAVSAAAVDVGQHLAMRSQSFQSLSFAAVVRVGVSVGTQVAVASRFKGPEGMLAGSALGAILASALLFVPNASLLRVAANRFQARLLRRALVRSGQYPRLSLPTALLQQVSESSLMLAAPMFFASADVGRIALGERLVTTPSKPFLQAVRATSLASLREVPTALRVDAIRRSALASIAGGVPLALAGVVFGERLFVRILGPEWAGAAVVSVLLGSWFVFRIPSSIANSVLILENRQAELLRVTTAGLIARVIAIGAGGSLSSVVGFVGIYALAGALTNVAVTYLALRSSRPSLRDQS